MGALTRRLFLRNTAAAGAVGTALVTPATADTAQVDTPSVRLANAIHEVKEAMRDLYGIWPDDGTQLLKSQGVVVLSVMPNLMDKVRWHIDDGSPLLADDVTGRTDFADWQKRRQTT